MVCAGQSGCPGTARMRCAAFSQEPVYGARHGVASRHPMWAVGHGHRGRQVNHKRNWMRVAVRAGGGRWHVFDEDRRLPWCGRTLTHLPTAVVHPPPDRVGCAGTVCVSSSAPAATRTRPNARRRRRGRYVVGRGHAGAGPRLSARFASRPWQLAQQPNVLVFGSDSPVAYSHHCARSETNVDQHRLARAGLGIGHVSPGAVRVLLAGAPTFGFCGGVAAPNHRQR